MKKTTITRYQILDVRILRRWLMFMGIILSGGIINSQACTPTIVGDTFSCENQTLQYALTNYDLLGLNAATDISWSLSGGGSLSATNGVLVDVTWTTKGFWKIYVDINPNINCPDGQKDTLDVYVSGNAAPQIACNDTLQVSLGIDCRALVTLDMITEGKNTFPEEEVNIWVYTAAGDTIPNHTLTKDQVNQIVYVTIEHICSGNVCSDKVLRVEDKLPPEDLLCQLYEIECNDDIAPSVGGAVGFPLPIGASTPIKIGTNKYLVSGIDACSDVTIEYVDNYSLDTCPYVGIIYRNWTASDGGTGTSISCTDTIRIKSGVIDGTIWPGDWTGLPGDNPILNCNGNWKRLPNGHPSEEYTGRPFNGQICRNIDVSFNDLRLDICENSYKLLREWIAVDWCNDTIAYHTQVIKVLDADGPQLNCLSTCADPMIVPTDPGTCVGSKVLPVPSECQNCGIVNIISECSSWEYEVKYKPAIDPTDCEAAINSTSIPTSDNIRQARDASGRPLYKNGRKVYEVFNLPPGYSWIEYTIRDACGNETKCTIELKVEEDEKPIAVCDLHTVITLSNDGTANAFAETFDDGSHDNCEFGGFKVRRMDASSCDNTQFGDEVFFCCEDILNNPIIVILRVFDVSGNFNECMVEVTVQDETKPVLNCPRSQTVYCGTDLSDLNVFGNPITSDDCPFTTDYKVTRSLNKCGAGRIIREWWLNKGLPSQVYCRQTIRVVSDPSFDFAGLVWPRSPYVRNNGCLNNLNPDDLPNNFKRPDVSRVEDACHNIYTSYSDKVYNIVQGACFKILRTWRVHDDCTNKTTEFVQVIKVLNSIAPQISCASSLTIPITGNDCSTYVELKAEATDSCSPNNSLIWSYEIDLNSNGTIDLRGNSNDASGIFEFGDKGKHVITWTVKDNCGNTSSCTTRFRLQDRKKPTPYCRTGIVTVVMEQSGSVEVWASDFNIGSFDNCTEKNDLYYYFGSNGRPNRIFSCSDINNGRDTTFEIYVWVRDLAGNRDFCTTQIILQDNQGKACDDNLNTGTVAGLIQSTNSNDRVSDVDILLEGNMVGGNQGLITSNDGQFAFPSIPLRTQYKITPSRNDDYLNGVSTRDLVIIQRHLLGISSFNTPYQFIAADANNSKSVSTRDIADLRKLILGKTDKLKYNKSWRFVPKDIDFIDPQAPYTYDENIQIVSLDGDAMHNDFYAVKVGDVNGDARVNKLSSVSTRSERTAYINVKNQTYDRGQDVEVVFNTPDVPMMGTQFTMLYDVNALTLVDIIPLMEDMTRDNFGWTELVDGYIRFSWNGESVPVESTMFKLFFKAKLQGELNNSISITEDKIPIELYDLEGNTISVGIKFRDSRGDEIEKLQQFELLQNKPNPFDESTIVAFILPKDDLAQLKIFNVNGKVIKLIKGQYSKGYNEIKIDKSELREVGVLYYQLETREHTATKKMILMD